MATANPASLVRQSKTNQVAQFLKGQSAVNRTLRPNPFPGDDRGDGLRVDDAGLFNTPVPMPTEPGPIDPPILMPPQEGATPGGPQAGPSNAGSWPAGVLPNGPITGFGYNPNGPYGPSAVPTFYGPSSHGYNPNGPQALPVPFGTQVTSSGPASGGNTGESGYHNTWTPYNVALSRTPGGHDANYWVF